MPKQQERYPKILEYLKKGCRKMQTSNERDIQRYKNCIEKDGPLLVQDAVICKKM